jgi:uncharacterized membrane protein YqjE
MEPRADSRGNGVPSLTDASKRLARHAIVIWENRVQLFLLEVEEERDQIIRMAQFGVGIAVFVMLACMTLTALITVACWQWSPVAVLSILFVVYSGIAGFFYWQLKRLQRNWQIFSDTLNELRKDHECLERDLK